MHPLIHAVRDLTADGMTAMQIAKQLGITTGHVHKLRAQGRRRDERTNRC